MCEWPQIPLEWKNETLKSDFTVLRKLRLLTTKCVGEEILQKTIRSPLEACLHLATPTNPLTNLIKVTFANGNWCSLEDFLNVSKVYLNTEDTPSNILFNYTGGRVLAGSEEVAVRIGVGSCQEGEWSKCPRCWKYIQTEQLINGLCGRCNSVEFGNINK